MQVVPPRSEIKIHTFVSDTQGCGAVRIINPAFYLTNYRDSNYSIYYTWSRDFIEDIRFYEKYTFVVFQRPAHDSHFRWLQWYKANVSLLIGTPCIADVDDLYFDIPKYNYASQYFEASKSQAESSLRWVNGIGTSSYVLKGELKNYNRSISVVPNHLPKYLWGEPTFRGKKTDKVRIVYPCSANHFATPDLVAKGITGGDIGPGMLEYIRKTVDKYEWFLIGHHPQELTDLVQDGKITIPGWQQPYTYPSFLQSLGADIGIAPLAYNRFNECKSNIKFLEFTAAGIPGVYTDIAPYREAQCTVVDDEEFIQRIEWLAESEENRRKTWEADHEVLRPHLFYEEHSNGLKTIDSYMRLFGKTLLMEPAKPSRASLPGGYPNNMKDLAGMIAAYCQDLERLAIVNMRGLNLPLALLANKPKYLHIIDERVPRGIEHLYKEAQDEIKIILHQIQDIPFGYDAAIIDCLETNTSILTSRIEDALTVSAKYVFIANTMLSPKMHDIVVELLKSYPPWRIRKQYDIWGGLIILEMSVEQIETKFIEATNPIMPGGITLQPHCTVEVLRPGENNAICE
jgi:hypothetical protein